MKILFSKKAQVAVEFIVLLFFVAPIAIYLINYVNNEFLKPFTGSISNGLLCQVRYGYSCTEVGVTDFSLISNIEGDVPIDVQSNTHPWDMVKNAW